jgi:tetratricopeptide (TPR) repeat protein
MFTDALRFYTQANESYHEARALNGLADAYLRTGRLDEADQALRTALAATDRVGALHEQASAHVTFARLAARRGEPAAERDHLHQALAIFTELGAPQAAEIMRRLAATAPETPPDEPGSTGPR